MNPRRITYILCLAALVAGLLLWYAKVKQSKDIPIGRVVEIRAPLGLPSVPIPKDNPPTVETIELGRRLYYDPALSSDDTISCASCHMPPMAFADGRRVSTGVGGKPGVRNSPSIINAAYWNVQFWDGRAGSLEKQTEGPVANPVEMAHSLKGVVASLSKDPSYRDAFARAFGPGPITYSRVEKCLATFERTILSGNSAFDRYYYGGDKSAMTEAQIRGLELFRDSKKGNCASCHTIGDHYALFTDDKFHNIGVGFDNDVTNDKGRAAISSDARDTGAFRTPSLRNVALTAPYMHDGSMKTLKEVMDFYVGGGNSNPYLDKEIHSLDFLTGQEREDLIDFMQALTGDMPQNVGPPTEPAQQAKN
jgi:cytochrome c peroxidase